MKILQALAGARHGGAERFFERLVPALHSAGVRQRVLFRSDAARFRHLTDAGLADLHQLPFGNRFDLVTRFAFRRQVQDFAPQIVFTWMNRASMMAPKSPFGTAKFVRVARLGGYYDLKYYRGCDYLVGDTQSIVDYLVRSGWPPDKAIYLPNFVGDRAGKPIDRTEFGVPEGARVLLGLGRLHGNKAFDVLLKAMVHVPDACLLLAGSGPEQGALEALAAELGVMSRIRFLGWRDDAADLLATADLFVHPARHEPLGNVVLEAWSQGVPVVCTASEGPKVLIEDGVSGRLTPVDESEPLAVAIRAALVDGQSARAMAAAGRKVYQQNYTEKVVVARYMDFFEGILRCAE